MVGECDGRDKFAGWDGEVGLDASWDDWHESADGVQWCGWRCGLGRHTCIPYGYMYLKSSHNSHDVTSSLYRLGPFGCIDHTSYHISYEVDSRLYLSAALEVLCTYHGLCMDEGVVGGSEAGTRTCSLGKQHVSMQDDREAVQNYLTS